MTRPASAGTAAPAWEKAFAWTERKGEFQKRAGFALAAYLAYTDKTEKDATFLRFLKVVEREAGDDRNYVRKAVNWALRNIGKRGTRLNRAAIATATRLRKSEVPVTRCVPVAECAAPAGTATVSPTWPPQPPVQMTPGVAPR